MNYEVLWTADAESDLANAWLDAADRSAVSLAADVIERQLTRSPLTFGRPRTSGVNRVAVFSPIGVTFEVIEDDKRVYVQSVFLYP